jgi:hypothetical protein
VDRTFSTHEEDAKCPKTFQSENINVRDQLGNLSINGDNINIDLKNGCSVVTFTI